MEAAETVAAAKAAAAAGPCLGGTAVARVVAAQAGETVGVAMAAGATGEVAMAAGATEGVVRAAGEAELDLAGTAVVRAAAE